MMQQITIVGPDQPGLMARISALLAEAGVNIEYITALAAGDQAAVSLSVNLPEQALTALREAGFAPALEESVLVRLRDEPGALARVLRRFLDSGVALRGLRLLHREGGCSLVALSTDRPREARQLISDLLAP